MITAVVDRVARRAVDVRAVKETPQHWGDFVLAEGLLDVYDASSDPHFLAGARRIVDSYVERGARFGTLVWQWAGIGLPALRLYRLTGAQEYHELGLGCVERLRRETLRTKDGGLTTNGPQPQLWIDVLHFSCPAFAETGQLKQDPSWFDEAARQFGVYLRHLKDETTGLVYHVWDERTDKQSPCFWGRGNGWLTLACADTLVRMPTDHPKRSFLAGVLRGHVEAVTRYQDPSGHRHTVLDRPDSYIETSCAAIFGLGMVRGVRLGALDRQWLGPSYKAWVALQDRVSADGEVFGVSTSTPPGDFDHYQRIATGVEGFGTGLFLQLGVEMSRL